MAEQSPVSADASASPVASDANIDNENPADNVPAPQEAAQDAPKAMPSSRIPTPLRKHRLPQWLDHFNRRDLTTTLRCTLAVWVAALLMFINPSLQRFGQATFFAGIVIYIMPPAGNLIVHIIGSLSLLLGMCLAWAWGLATMKAAQSVRSPEELNAKLQALRQMVAQEAQATGNNNTAFIAQGIVHDGFMLDARITAIYFVMGCVFIYFVSRIRYAVDKAVLFQLFGIIAIDIFILFGPTLTVWTPRLPELVILPAACGIAIAIACALFIFPQSTNQQAVGQIQDVLKLLTHPIETGRQFIAGATDIDADLLKQTRRRVIGLYSQLQPSMAFLPLDISRGRWSGDDVKNVHKKFLDVLIATSAMLDFQVARLTKDTDFDKFDDLPKPAEVTEDNEKQHKRSHARRLKITENRNLIKALIAPGTIVGSEEMRQALRGSSEAVMDTSSAAAAHVLEALSLVNANRWWTSKKAAARLPELIKESKEICAQLARAREACITETTNAGLRIHGSLFDDQGVLKEEMQGESKALAGLVIAFVIEEHIIGLSIAFENMTALVAQLLEERKTNQFWGPLKIGRFFSWMTESDKTTGAPAIAGEGIEDPDRIQQQTRETQRRLRVVTGGEGIPKKRGNFFTRFVVGIARWLTSGGSLYAFRVVAVTIATSIPAVIPHSAGFFYREKGIWAVVTAQTCILMYMADFTFSILTRTLATILGGVIALAIWYIGSGSGDGNRYGLAAAMLVGIFIFVWARLWLPSYYLQATSLGAATFSLIIGYSWDERHLVVFGLPGVGYVAFWKRLVTVLIGFFAALIVQMLPSPPSGTHHVAKTLANTLHQLNDHYALLISHWGSADPNKDWRGARGVVTSTTLGIGETLASLTTPIFMLKFESSMSPFDIKTLHRIQELLMKINQNLGKLMLAATTLPMEHQQRLIRNTGILDEISINNVMAVLTIAKQSLRNGSPLPERLPTPLLQTCYADYCDKHKTVQLHRDYIGSEEFRSYCVALSCYLALLHYVDELVSVLKASTGESHIVHDWSEISEQA